MTQTISFGYGSKPAQLLSNKLNRHGVIAGATGTGKTVTLKVLAEQLSEAGVPVLLSDIKGDLASLAEKGEVTEKIAERLKKVHVEDFEPSSYPVAFWDILLPLLTILQQEADLKSNQPEIDSEPDQRRHVNHKQLLDKSNSFDGLLDKPRKRDRFA